MDERTIAATIHGRYLVEPAGPGSPLLVGFHGYAEAAETELQRLRSIEGSNRWTLVAVQGLHRFYRGRSNDVVASWMTRQDRELAIEDNKAYTAAVMDLVSVEYLNTSTTVLSGFSQGVAMAFRCAAGTSRPIRGVIALGGDIPPELDSSVLSRIPAVLIGRGTTDEWYTPEKAAADERRLTAAGVKVEVVTFEGGHEWTPSFAHAVSRMLDAIWPRA